MSAKEVCFAALAMLLLTPIAALAGYGMFVGVVWVVQTQLRFGVALYCMGIVTGGLVVHGYLTRQQPHHQGSSE